MKTNVTKSCMRANIMRRSISTFLIDSKGRNAQARCLKCDVHVTTQIPNMRSSNTAAGSFFVSFASDF